MDFRVLGPLEVCHAGEPLALGGAQQRAVIALLVLSAPEPVARDQLIDELWRERPPATAAHAVEVYVSALRKLLRPAGERVAVRSSGSGYALEAAPDVVDARRFERLLREGQDAVAHDVTRARRPLEQALELWHGTPLSDLDRFEFARREAARLAELRAQAVECLVEARLARGEHAEVISALTGLVAAEPLRENPRRLLMLALYRDGRHAEALAAYRNARAALDDVGLRPGPELRELEAAILRHDASLRAAPPGVVRSGSAPAPAAPADARRRKVVTVMCCDMGGSGAGLDPEALLEATDGVFAQLRGIVERHGGTVARVFGDTAVAVFGFHRVREDDAWRAVRTAAEVRSRLAAVRGAIDTGLVLAGDLDSLVVGEPVSVATRLAQAAEPGEILLGGQTYALVREAVEAEALGPVALPARPEPVAAYRLLATGPASPGSSPRRRVVPLVGRRRELAVLRAAWERTVQGGSCHLFTLLGAPGVGKSRLAEELFGALGERAKVLSGRCLHYGEGITFWPIAEALAQIGPAARPVLERIDGAAATRREEVFWEVRQALETAALAQPVILHVDDLQWGEPMLRELLDHLAEYSRGAPILLLCLARPELLEESPAWGGGKPNATSVMLDGLEQDECELLVERLGGAVPADSRARVISASGGNPLFLQELVALARERGAFSVPATIQALLAARLERLAAPERELVERAAIEGEVFHLGAVRTLAGAQSLAAVRAGLAELVRQDLIRPCAPTVAGDQAFRFRHLLIRDAAYESLAKATRTALHERFAGWLETSAPELPERHEIAGWHLEQAVRFQSELGRPVDTGLAHRAAEHLRLAGRRAMQRSDTVAARRLLERARSLAGAPPLGARIAVDLAEALIEGGDLQRVDALLSEAEGHPDVAAAAGLVRLHWLTLVRLDEAMETIGAVLPETLRRLAAAGDESGLAKAHLLGFWAASQAGLMHPAADHAARAAAHARKAGDEGLRSRAMGLYVVALVHGPPDADTLAGELTAIEAEEPGPYLAALVGAARGEVERLRGDMARARRWFQEAIAGFRGLQIHTMVAGTQDFHAWAELWGGEAELALPGLERIDADLAVVGERGFRSTVQATLALVFERLGDEPRARAAVELAEAFTAPHDLLNLVLIDLARARLALLDGEPATAERHARAAVEQAARTDLPFLQGIAHLELGRLLLALGSRDDARSAAMSALALFHTRDDRPRIAQVRELLDAVA